MGGTRNQIMVNIYVSPQIWDLLEIIWLKSEEDPAQTILVPFFQQICWDVLRSQF